MEYYTGKGLARKWPEPLGRRGQSRGWVRVQKQAAKGNNLLGGQRAGVHSTRTNLPMKMEHTECSETSAYKIQTPGYHPKEAYNIPNTAKV